jgi:hypothetical protein
MTANDDDPIASWQDRIGSLRKRGRISAAAVAVIPAEGIDVRLGRPLAPERLSGTAERQVWDKLTFSRRPGWFAGAEEILEAYVCTMCDVQELQAALRKAKPVASARYQKRARLHRHTLALALSLAVRLRLTPSTKLDKRTPQDGELPVT